MSLLSGQAELKLKAVAQLKTDQINRWFEERIADGRALQSGPEALVDLPQFLSGSRDPSLVSRLESWIRSIRLSYPDYAGVFLVGEDGRPLLFDAEEGLSLSARKIFESTGPLSVAEPFLTEIQIEGVPRMGMAVPVAASPGEAPRAAFLVWIDPARYLYPILQRWPVPSTSGEIILLRKEGNEIVSVGRHGQKENTAPELRIPLSGEESIESKAFKGAEGIFRGRDYRGALATAYAEPVGKAGWILVAKKDDSEIFDPLWGTVPLLLGIILFMCLATVFGTILMWRRREVSLLRERFDAISRRAEAEERFRLIFENAADAVFVHEVSPELPGRFVDVNSGACRLLGYTRDEMLSMDVAAIDVPEQASRLPAIMRKLFDEGVAHFETEHVARDGRRIPVDVHTSLFEFQGSRLVLSVARDITERRVAEGELERERSQLLSIFDTIDESIYVADPATYEILFVNKFLREILGFDPTGRICHEVLQGLDSPCPFCTNSIILSNGGKAHVWEFHNLRLNRDYKLFDRIVKWSDGRDVRFEMAIDITDRKRAEEELIAYSRDLEKTVEERTHELDSTRAEMFAQAKLSAMGRMGAGLAHQLNSPLGGAVLLVDGLIDSLGNEGGHREALRHVRTALDNMHNIVECMLTLSMLPRRGRVFRASVDLSKAIGSILDLALHDCTGRGIEISRELAEGLPKIPARSGELDQVFLNLVNNA
ncbi:MAG TPA: PAS domain S-box protein, partial [bacterium]|nr:PAS domain S-box protein [bacterium]